VFGAQSYLEKNILKSILSKCLGSFVWFSGGKGVEEAAENRNYLSSRMSEEVGEMVRVLQLTTYDEDEWDSDNLVRILSVGIKRYSKGLNVNYGSFRPLTFYREILKAIGIWNLKKP
jgi:hypothetical protein